MNWETVYGSVNISKQIILLPTVAVPKAGTSTSMRKGIPDGTVGTGPGSDPHSHQILAGQVATNFEEGGCECIGLLPDIWTPTWFQRRDRYLKRRYDARTKGVKIQ